MGLINIFNNIYEIKNNIDQDGTFSSGYLY